MSFYGVTDPWTYVVGAFGIILLPGPNSLYVLSVATTRGVRAGFQGAYGVYVGDMILLLCTALGAASLLRTHPALFMVLKYAGAAYLFWVGLNLLRSAIAGLRKPAEVLSSTPPAAAPSSAAAAAAHLQRPFRRALLISLLNPKAILFLLSFFVQFIDPAYAEPEVPFLILSAILMSFSAAYLTVLIFAGARLAQTFSQRKRLSSGLSSLVGALFVWFGAKLATASLS
ncbi:MAG: leucine efflux protein LeuE [Gammaproteobacteria bacterium]|uniref:leucine efflux protein LeuE n=1 Tax=Rhodoferax sp. TaxID=50421 RepID=UPI0017E96BCD|nr:leucine efflux protein LeuE [Rhodoferax sp.]MBU3899047.1 leucine efflux protein LeuE [Gammaproteobacteria bacterium]MBA3057653.1 leucine efflux protein LeuE [Rhodoferax sp.]MBU3998264.1 leucine efflux protein LeuE [Gammaproteobacteria bacterium]MBU4018490.1 leucine efflux protein LeuE [Gammaproteobacteria bacterium]MBU4080502.1 leucine efflux protein LeuE [Gammaproteobacteria bacterium]